MKTRILPVNDNSLSLAAEIINEGGIVAFPTETVYGLGANAFNAQAVEQIFVAKGRPQDNPLIVHVSNRAMIDSVAYLNDRAEKLISAFCPAPITVILPKKQAIPYTVTAGLDTVGVRMPRSSEARDFIARCNVPIAAPSANTSTRPSPTRAQDVYEDMSGRIPLILSGEDCDVGIESTVISLIDKPTILRPGMLTAGDIEAVLGEKVYENTSSVGKVSSPGVKYPHYMPKVPTCLVMGGNADAISRLYMQNVALNPVVLCSGDVISRLPTLNTYCLGSDSYAMAQGYYTALRTLEKKYGYIIQVYDRADEAGLSLLNRMRKSANGVITEE